MQGLYAIVDVLALEARELDVLRFAEAVLDAGPAALQLRDKRQNTRDHLRLLRAIAPRCADRGVALVANDRPDLAALAGCTGVHLGQSDLPVADARRVLAALGVPHALVGMSVHDDAELDVALAADPDYLAFGPVFGTTNKVDPEPTIGPEGLAHLVSRARERTQAPTVAIGSIRVTNLELVTDHVDCVAVIGALLPPQNADDPYRAVTARAAELVRGLAPARHQQQGAGWS